MDKDFKFDLEGLKKIVDNSISNITPDNSTFKKDMERQKKEIQKKEAEKEQRDIETHENTKRTREATEDIAAKFNYVADDLDYILNSLGKNFQRLERLGIEEKETLDQILLALQYKDKNSKSKIKSLLEEKGIDVILNAIIALVQMKMTGK